MKKLYIAMNNQLVGIWKYKNEDNQSFQYIESWIDSKYARSISLSMPIREKQYTGDVVKHFFTNLIPERKDIIEYIQRKYSIKKNDAFSILTVLGKDCIGAIQISEDSKYLTTKQTIDGKILNETQISNLIKQTKLTKYNINDSIEPFKISLTGVQDKLALLYDGINWKDPLGTTPSTHIFKLPIAATNNINIFNSIENEWYCSNFFRIMNLPVASSEILSFCDEKVLSVERFDRKFDNVNNRILRIPQEDFCQVLNVPYFQKYQIDGGPNASDILNVLKNSENKDDELLFFKAQILNWLISATDGHAKNYSIELRKNSTFKLTPFYDIMSFAPYVGSGKGQIHSSKIKLAMSIKGSSNQNKYKINNISKTNWDQTANFLKINKLQYNNLLEEIIENSVKNVEILNSNLPKNFPSIISEKITNDIIKHINILKN